MGIGDTQDIIGHCPSSNINIFYKNLFEYAHGWSRMKFLSNFLISQSNRLLKLLSNHSGYIQQPCLNDQGQMISNETSFPFIAVEDRRFCCQSCHKVTSLATRAENERHELLTAAEPLWRKAAGHCWSGAATGLNRRRRSRSVTVGKVKESSWFHFHIELQLLEWIWRIWDFTRGNPSSMWSTDYNCRVGVSRVKLETC